MRTDGLSRRLAALENGKEEEELVPISFQWMKEDGTLFGPLIERMVPKSRFGWLNEAQLEKRLEDLERQQAEPTKFKLLWYDEEQGPHDPRAEVIKLRWFDEVEKEY
jgi:hypothetical protein